MISKCHQYIPEAFGNRFVSPFHPLKQYACLTVHPKNERKSYYKIRYNLTDRLKPTSLISISQNRNTKSEWIPIIHPQYSLLLKISKQIQTCLFACSTFGIIVLLNYLAWHHHIHPCKECCWWWICWSRCDDDNFTQSISFLGIPGSLLRKWTKWVMQTTLKPVV